MIPVIHAQISVSEFLNPQTSGRVFRGAMTFAHRAMARQAELFLRRHTAPGASARYGYKRRSPQYVKRARAANRDWRPLKATGELENSLRETQQVQANYSMGKLVIRARLGGMVGVTDRFRMKKGQFSLSKQQEQLVMRKAEITAVTNDEERDIGQAGVRAFAVYLKSGSAGRRMSKYHIGHGS